MMPQLVFVALGAAAVLATVGAMTELDPLTRILSAGIAALTWFIWAANAEAVGIALDTGVATTSLPGLLIMGYLMGATMTGIALFHALRTLRDDETELEDELDLGGLR